MKKVVNKLNAKQVCVGSKRRKTEQQQQQQQQQQQITATGADKQRAQKHTGVYYTGNISE